MAAAVSLPNPDRFGYLKPKDVARLAEAYRFSEAAHAWQTRQSGDPYISDTFGKPVAELVDGVSKLDRIEFQSAEDAQAENFRKMLLAMARDVRVILIKLADRLHNMRTLGAVPPAKRWRSTRRSPTGWA